MSFFSSLRQSPTLIMWVLVVVVITGAIETDIFVPSFPAIKDYFATTETMVQMIVGINFLGLCFSSLIYGPLADAYGRKPILLTGIIIFLLASIGCILSKTIETLLMWRFIQGLGTSVVFIVPGAIIYDIYNKEQAAKTLGWFGALITFSMACAPMLGSYIQTTLGWQTNFIFIGFLSLLSFVLVFFFMPDTLAIEKRMSLNYKEIAINYFKVLTSRASFWYMLIICCLFAGELIYITNLSLIFIDHLNIDQHLYSYYQGVILFIFAFFSYFSGRLIYRFGIIPMRNAGLVLSILGGFCLLLTALTVPENALLITISMCIYSLGFALCCGIIFGDIMHIFPEIKGLVSALSSFIRLLFISLMIVVAGMSFDGTILPVAWMIAIFCVLILIGWAALPKVTIEKH